MPQMTPAQVRVIDPILTSVAQGYSQPDLVGMSLFPQVPVNVSGGQIIEFGKEAFKAYSTIRAPGADARRIQFGHLGRPFALENHALEGVLPWEHMRDAAVTPGVDLGRRALNQTMAAMRLALEVQQATIATNAANYDAQHKVTLAGASLWSAATGNPITDIEAAREAIRVTTGRYPNTITFSAVAWKAFRNNPNVLDKIKYVQKGVLTEDLAAALLDIPNVRVGRAVSATDAGVFSDVWGNNVVLAYTALGSLGAEEPSYGYTYTMDGNPVASAAYYWEPSRSWIYPVFYERLPVLSGVTAGYLIQTPN